MMRRMEGYVSDASFVSILILDGEGTVICAGQNDGVQAGDGQEKNSSDRKVSYKKGDSLFLPAGSGGICDRGKLRRP